jgi:hypothetical protein
VDIHGPKFRTDLRKTACQSALNSDWPVNLYVAVTGFRAGGLGAIAVVSVSGLASIGWMAVTNFLINSDFKWLILVFALPWGVALALSGVSDKQPSEVSNLRNRGLNETFGVVENITELK